MDIKKTARSEPAIEVTSKEQEQLDKLHNSKATKDINELIFDTKESLQILCRDSGLPISILVYILKDIFTEVNVQNEANNLKIIQNRKEI